MKKTLLSLAVLCTALTASSQILQQDDFSTLTIGIIGTDLTGLTTGQGDFHTAGTATSEFQIIDGGLEHGNVFQFTGSATATGNKFMWKTDFATQWEFRDPANNILAVEFDYYSGPVSASKNDMRIMVFNADKTKYLTGIVIKCDTRVVSGIAYYDNSAAPGGVVGNYNFGLGANAATPIVMPPDTWWKMGFSFNKTTGQVRWVGPGFNGFVLGAAIGVDPDEIDFIAATAPANTVAGVNLFDNYEAKATNADNLLTVVETVAVDSNISVFPNPATNLINVANGNSKITGVTLTDLNGRIVKQNAFDNLSDVQIDISDLSVGMYMMEITSDEGIATKKIIKN